MAESGQTIDMRYLGSSHVSLVYFEYYLPRWLTDVLDFDIGTPLSQGTRRDHIERGYLPTEDF
jgi:hypothetical protein